MRDKLAAKAARHGLLYVVFAFGLAGCGGGGGGGSAGDDDDGGSGGGGTGGGGGGGGGGDTSIPTDTSSSQTAYVTPTASGWDVVPLVTVGDTPSSSSYAMVGKPDGLGAF